MRDRFKFLVESWVLMLVLGMIALIWAQIDHHQFHDLVHSKHSLTVLGISLPTLSIEFTVVEILMPLFFAVVMIECAAAFRKGGALNDPRRAALPILATVGGIAAPIVVFLIADWRLNAGLARAFLAPTATDIPITLTVAGFLIFKRYPVGRSFLLLLAIADDLFALLLIPVVYPQKALEWQWSPLILGGLIVAYIMGRFPVRGWGWYLIIPGPMLWFGFHEVGFHTAMSLAPIVLCMPHAQRDLGFFREIDLDLHGPVDTQNRLEHALKHPVAFILGAFAFVSLGFEFSAMGSGTFLVLAGLVIGKPVGIVGFSWIGMKLGLELPDGMNMLDVIGVSLAAAIGFTVSLFVASVAVDPGLGQDALRMGAFLSLPVVTVLVVFYVQIRIQLESLFPQFRMAQVQSHEMSPSYDD